jgi:O-antigen ligase
VTGNRCWCEDFFPSALKAIRNWIETMPPTIALLLWIGLLAALMLFDPAKAPDTSLAVWIPVIWMFIVGSRLPSQWLTGQVELTAAWTPEGGNPLDRTIYLALILLSVSVLVMRSFPWGQFFARNFFLTAFLLFALVSIFWSDFPFVAFKRWFRDLGSYLVILATLSDPCPLEAVRTVFRRSCYLLIPLSILLIKYYPQIGRGYDIWTGTAMYGGASLGKNGLGAVCMISGLFFFWDTLTRWADRKAWRAKRIILVNFAFMAMTLWLLNLATSSTSRVCLALGCLVIAAAHTNVFTRHSGFLKVMVPASFCLYLLLAFGLGLNGELAATVGRDPTFTDRTEIWGILLSMRTNPLVGTGYESFWLGPRFEWVWHRFPRLNEAHNGYLEVYLNLGLAGLTLLVGFLIVSYRKICKIFTLNSSVASLSLAFWLVTVFYNMTEAAFKIHLIWETFLLGVVAIPTRAKERVPTGAEVGRCRRFGRVNVSGEHWFAKR